MRQYSCTFPWENRANLGVQGDWRNDSCSEDLRFWIRSNRNQGQLRILTSCDDFLNDCSDWKALQDEQLLSTEALMILKQGGHLGYLGSRWFKKFIKGEL